MFRCPAVSRREDEEDISEYDRGIEREDSYLIKGIANQHDCSLPLGSVSYLSLNFNQSKDCQLVLIAPGNYSKLEVGALR